MTPPRLVIFDCDGILVDSEALTIPAMGRLLARYGLHLQHDEMRTHTSGVTTRQVRDIVWAQWGVSLPEDFADLLEDVERRAVELGLRAVPGVADAIEALTAAGIATCVASNGPPEAIEQRLKLTGLYPSFEGRIFSASMVARGKPHPDLFLHAAQTLGVPPSQCVVVEDSAPGARAGLAAGMRVLVYATAWNTAAAHAPGVERFSDMAALPALLGKSNAICHDAPWITERAGGPCTQQKRCRV